jgi:hypothetical protein
VQHSGSLAQKSQFPPQRQQDRESHTILKMLKMNKKYQCVTIDIENYFISGVTDKWENARGACKREAMSQYDLLLSERPYNSLSSSFR